MIKLDSGQFDHNTVHHTVHDLFRKFNMIEYFFLIIEISEHGLLIVSVDKVHTQSFRYV